MKTRIFLLIVLGVLLFGQSMKAQDIPAKLTIDMNGFSLGKEAILRGNGNTLFAETNAEGKAFFEIPLKSPAYFILSISSSENQIYLLPGQELKATLIPEIQEIKGQKRKIYNLDQLLIQFEGTAAPINEYLNEFVMEELPGKSFLLDQTAYIKEMEKLIDRNWEKIKQFKMDEQFKKREYIRMKYHILEALTRYPFQHYWKGGNQLGLIYDHGEDMSIVHNYLTNELKDDEELWQEEKYRNFFGRAIGTLTGIYKKNEREKMFLDRLEKATSLVKSKVILEDYVQELALNYIDLTERDSLGSLHSIYEQYVQKQDYKEALEKAMTAWKESSIGTEFAKDDSTYIDINGNAFSLASLKGKYVYIDVWATWCGPCRQELPHLKKLEEKFHGKNIAFVSISIDNRQKDWERMVTRDKMTGIQLYGGPQAPIVMEYQIEGIPRFFLIDREGKIINKDMTRPSDPLTEKTLNELEGI